MLADLRLPFIQLVTTAAQIDREVAGRLVSLLQQAYRFSLELLRTYNLHSWLIFS